MADFNYADEAGIIALATEIRKRIPSYAVCSTPAATAAKTIDNLTGFDLRAGATIRIKFTYGNTAPNPTLNINNTGAKEIYKHGTDKPGGSAKTSWQDESVVTMTYDGTAWFMNAYAEDVTMMEGATSTTPGTSGYVPAPAAGDQDKVLQGDGTWGVSPGVKKYPVTGTVTNTSGSYTHIFEDEHITPDMEVDRIELGSPEVFGDKLHFVCGNGTVTMTCSEVSGTSTIKMWCQKVIVDPTAVTSTEFDILNNRLLKVENVEINYAVSITPSQWTPSENEYVYTWTNDRVENGSSVSVEFADNANSVDVDYIDVEQITGGVKLYAPWAPEDMVVNIKVTNARSKEIANITADMVATNAVATATDVEGALTRLNTTVGDHGTDIDDLQDNVETLFNAGSKILPIITGTLNNSGYTINSGDYFEANGNLYKATAAIPINESWSSSSDALTTSALSDIHAKMGAVGNNSLQSQITTLNSNLTMLDSQLNNTTDILADAVNCTHTQFFKGSGSDYTGIVPNNDNTYRYATFMVNYRAPNLRTVIAHALSNKLAINAYNGSWSGWQELATNSEIGKYVLTTVVRAEFQTVPSTKRMLIWLYDTYTSSSANHGFRIDFDGTSKAIAFAELSNGSNTTLFTLHAS